MISALAKKLEPSEGLDWYELRGWIDAREYREERQADRQWRIERCRAALLNEADGVRDGDLIHVAPSEAAEAFGIPARRLRLVIRTHFKVGGKPLPRYARFLLDIPTLRQLADRFSLPLVGRCRSTALRSSTIVGDKRFPPGELLTKSDTALILGISIRGVEYLMRAKRDDGSPKRRALVPIRIGGRVLFRRAQVMALKRKRDAKKK